MPQPMLMVFALTLLTSATLLFLVQPIVGKMVTPLFGGSPAVWNTCMVFFQGLLLAGYGYAHATAGWLGARKQAVVHLLVLLVPLAFFPLAIDRSKVPSTEGDPIVTILLLLTFSVGVPFLVVSASAPLLQRWFATTDHPAARDPYFLYGASNLGSMLALLGYPTVVEPWLSLTNQRWLWCAGYGVLVVLFAACAVYLWRSKSPPEPAGAALSSAPRPPLKTSSLKRLATPDRAGSLDNRVTTLRRLRWVALAATPSSLMLGVTTYITMDIAPVPLLWVLPLALYLLSFILVFSRLSAAVQSVCVWLVALAGLAVIAGQVAELIDADWLNWLRILVWAACAVAAAFSFRLLSVRDIRFLHRACVLALAPLILLLLLVMMAPDGKPPVSVIALHLVTFFAVALVCHGELALDRPAPGYLTEFYLWLSVGGVLGGLFNALVAPLIFNAIVEYQLVLAGACFLLPPWSRPVRQRPWRLTADLVLLATCLLIGGALLALRLCDRDLDLTVLSGQTGVLIAAALVAGVIVGAGNVLRGQRRSVAAYLDLALPGGLVLLMAGLYWGLLARSVAWVFAIVTTVLPHQLLLYKSLAFGLPTALCFTFVFRPIRLGLGVGALALTSATCRMGTLPPVFQDRSFFGVVKVVKRQEELHKGVVLTTYRIMNGSTFHGMQFRDPLSALDVQWRRLPLMYYHATGPVGRIFTAYNSDPSRPVGVIGLGAGTMATYALEGQHLTFYEIDPVVRAVSFDSDRYFTYVSDARQRGAKIDIVMGDARLTLERQHFADPDKFGLLVVDAFSSDSVPIHLITREALQLYLDRARPDGIILFHITQQYLDLKPVLANLAADCGVFGYSFSDGGGDRLSGKLPSLWVALFRQPPDPDRLYDLFSVKTEPGPGPSTVGRSGSHPRGLCQALAPAPDVGVWTDDYSNLLRVFMRRGQKGK